MKSIAAYTETNYSGSYPAYISINEHAENISIAVRSTEASGYATIYVTPEILKQLAELINLHLINKP